MSADLDFWPEYVTIGPVEHREFAPDGRLIIYPEGGARGSWSSLISGYGVLVPIPLDWEWFEAHAAMARDMADVKPETGDPLWPQMEGAVEMQGYLSGYPSLRGVIRTTADSADPKWAAAGFRSGQPWSGAMPALSRREQRQFTGLRGFDRERVKWQKNHPDQAEALS